MTAHTTQIGISRPYQSIGHYSGNLKIRHKNVSFKLQTDHINGMALDNIKHSAMSAPSAPLPHVTILAPLSSETIQSFNLRSFFNSLDSKTRESVKRRETSGPHLASTQYTSRSVQTGSQIIEEKIPSD